MRNKNQEVERRAQELMQEALDEKDTIKAGDIVHLLNYIKPKLVVGDVHNSIAQCYWYDQQSSEIRKEEIHIVALVRVTS